MLNLWRETDSATLSFRLQILLACIFLAYIVGQYVQAWYRLRHIKGPFFASITTLWLLKKSMSGRVWLDFARVYEKYGGSL
jgi:hypothetical protein